MKTTAGPLTIYVITNSDDCTTISNICLQKESIYDFSKPWLGNGLLTSAPSQWKVHRKLLNPSFSSNVVDSFIDLFNSKSRGFVSNLKAEAGRGLFDQFHYTGMFALEMICLTAFCVDIGENNPAHKEFVTAMGTMLNVLISRFQTFWLHSNFILNFSSLKKKQDNCVRILQNMSTTILKDKKEKFLKNLSNIKSMKETAKVFLCIQVPKVKPFMDLILELAHETNVFTDGEIRDHVDTIIEAGHDTFATALTYCLMLVGANPKVQEKIHEELKKVFGVEDRDVTKQDLSELVYSEAVIKESIRLYPTVPSIGRYISEDIKLRNYTLYKGSSVFLHIYSIYRHPVWGPDTEEFKPERWLDRSTLPDSPICSVGFGLGRRNCIGKSYAMKAMKISMAHICRNLILHGEHSNLKLKLDVFLQPVSGYYISIEKRK